MSSVDLMPLSATAVTAGRQQRRRAIEHVHVDGQRPQVAAVDADDPGTGVDGAGDFGGVVHLDEAGQPQRMRVVEQLPECAVVERGDNQQCGVRARRRRFQQLVSRNDEVLAQQRHRNRRTRAFEVLERAVEERRLGQHRDRRRAGRRIAARMRGRVVVVRAGCRATASGACTRR